MKIFRIVFGVLAIIPLALLVDGIFIHPATENPGSLTELIYLACGVPILIITIWAWVYPEIIELIIFYKN